MTERCFSTKSNSAVRTIGGPDIPLLALTNELRIYESEANVTTGSFAARLW